MQSGAAAGAAAARVAVVTGSNKGIGFEAARKLCRLLPAGSSVYITSRDEALGEAAAERLREEGLMVRMHQLDITDDTSVAALRDHIATQHGGLDILINNAGFAYKAAATEPAGVQARGTIAVNVHGTRRVCDALLPLVRH